MKLACLFSGGKDSTFALYRILQEKHEIVCLLTMKSKRKDSYMYHLPNIHLAEYSAQALDIPLIFSETSGEKEKELIELEKELLALKKSQGIKGVVSGAVASNYQKERIDNICKKLKLKSIAPLWHKDEKELVEEMLANGFKIMIVGVAAAGLDEKWLGMELNEKSLKELIKLKEKYGVSLVGEGGEFETLVIDCPIFKKKINVIESEKKFSGTSGELVIKKIELIEKGKGD